MSKAKAGSVLLLGTRRMLSSADKGALSRIRKETGFAISKCHEALKKFANNEVLARDWLQGQALQEGWIKAQKLQGRANNSGLVGLTWEDNYGAIIEVNCETDFVCRSKLFQELAAKICSTALDARKSIVKQNLAVNSLEGGSHDVHLKEDMLLGDLLSIKPSRFEPPEELQDSITHVVGKLGENISISRATTLVTSRANIVGGYSHGSVTGAVGSCFFGELGTLVVIKPPELHNTAATEHTTRRLAQHITGLNPLRINTSNGTTEDDEDTLMLQPYLHDNKRTVGEVLKQSHIEVIDFVRFGG